jgi:hypothetical protein
MTASGPVAGSLALERFIDSAEPLSVSPPRWRF